VNKLIMKKLAAYMASILLVLASQAVLAQHSGHGMSGGMGSGSYGHDSSAMKDMQRMMAVQANDEQKAQFRTWTQSTDALRQDLQDLERITHSDDYAKKIAALKTRIEETKNGKELLERSLSSAQQAGLKKNMQKVNKANDQLEQAVRELDQSHGRTPKLTKALQAATKLSAEQKKLGAEMGI
jgi:DNA repair exonuclease SbcCD ATPase subunit